MQNLDPKDRPKLIGISVALGVVVIIGVKTTIDTVSSINPPNKPASAATPSPAPPTVSGVTTPGAAVAADGTATPDNNTYSLDRFPFVAAGGRDPFAPVPDDVMAGAGIHLPNLATPAPSPAAPEPNKPLPGGPVVVRTMPSGGLDNGFIKERNTVSQPVVPPPPVVRVLPPAAPPYNVIGVVISEPAGRDVAILQRTNGKDKKFVVVGDPLEGGFTVTGIESGGVRVKHPGEKPVTSPIPGVAPTQLPGSTEYFLPRQTIVVPATSMTMPLGETSNPATPGTPAPAGVSGNPMAPGVPVNPGVPVAQYPAPRAK